jgi:membrane protein DedA with SNARE-associated domain
MTAFFSTLVDFVHAHSQYTHIAIFLLALSEAIPVVGTVVPGSTLIIGISALATSANANPWLLVIAATAGAIIGDGLSFWLGQRYHREILNSWPLNKYPHLIARSERFVTQYGAASVFLARFAPVVRAFVPLVSGILRMSPESVAWTKSPQQIPKVVKRPARCPCAITFRMTSTVSCPGVMVRSAAIPANAMIWWSIIIGHHSPVN